MAGLKLKFIKYTITVNEEIHSSGDCWETLTQILLDAEAVFSTVGFVLHHHSITLPHLYIPPVADDNKYHPHSWDLAKDGPGSQGAQGSAIKLKKNSSDLADHF